MPFDGALPTPCLLRPRQIPTVPVEIAPNGAYRNAAGLWLLNGPGAALDLSVNRNSGTPFGGPTLAGTAMGPATRFSGAQYVNVPRITALNPGTVTVWTWLQTTASATSYPMAVGSDQTGGSTDRQFQLRLQGASATAQFIPFNASTNGSISGSTSLNDGGPHLVVASWDGGHIYLEVDGKQDAAPVAFSGALRASTIPLLIGAAWTEYSTPTVNAVGNYFNGSLWGTGIAPFMPPVQRQILYRRPFAGLRPKAAPPLFFSRPTTNIVAGTGSAAGISAAAATGIAITGATGSVTGDSTAAANGVQIVGGISAADGTSTAAAAGAAIAGATGSAVADSAAAAKGSVAATLHADATRSLAAFAWSRSLTPR